MFLWPKEHGAYGQVAFPLALLFVASTLAVRVVILHVRGGGDPRAAQATRRAALGLAAGGAGALTAAARADVLSAAVLLAAAPGLVTAAAVAAKPPDASQLRALGWTLVGVSGVTGAIVIMTLSR